MSRKKLILSTAALALAGVSQIAFAQDDAGDIIVTARRVEERLQDVPISITAFSQQQLTNRNIVSAGDIALYTPSLAANSRFGPEKTSFAIRGFNQDTGTSASVGVYFADAPALRVVSSTAGGNGAGPGAFFDLQNLQVLKGPQGTLFGRNTSGGAVLLVPQKPTGKLEGYVEGSVGNYDLRRVQAVVNVPVTDTLRVRLGIDRQTRTGYMKNASDIGPSNFNNVDYWAGRLSVVADLTPNLENYFVGTFSKSSNNGFLPSLIACNRTQAATTPATAATAVVALQCAQLDRQNARGDFYSGEGGIINPYQKVEQWQLINTTTWKASDNLTIKNVVSYGQFREAVRGTVYGEHLVIPSGPNAGQSALRVFSNPYQGRNLAAQTTFTEELQFQGTGLNDRLTWQVGGYLELNDPLGFAGVISTNTASCATADSFTGCAPFSPGAGLPAATGSMTSRVSKFAFQDYGIFGQSTFKMTDTLSVTGGLRYTWDYYQVTTRQLTYRPFPVAAGNLVGVCVNGAVFGAPGSATNPGGFTEAQCETYQRAHSSAPTWLIDLDYKPTSDILVYAKYARGYRQGGLKIEGYGREAFAPERIDNYEVGVKTSWRGPVRGTLNIAGFYNDFSNQQITTSGTLRIAGTTPAQLILNAGKSRIAGVEVDASLSPFKGLQIDAGYAYLDTKVKSIVTPDASSDPTFSGFTPGGARVGYPLTYSPKNKFTITGTYTLPLDESVGRISVGATFSHVDSQYANYQDTGLFLSGAIPSDYGLLPALNLLNLNVNWNSVAGSPMDLAFFATNVTKQKYYNATFGGYPSFGLEAGAVAEPRMYGVRLKYRFGS